MTIGLVGRKIGMTRIFTPEGEAIPVSVIEVQANRIIQIKTLEKEGYRAIQVTMGERRASRVTQPMKGHYASANMAPGLGLWEFRLDNQEGEDLAVGGQLTVELFTQGGMVDVSGQTKGHGFTGTIKRWNFAAQRNSHGNSLSHRVPGSIGQNQTPGKVFKGKKMSGHYGDEQQTIQNLEIIRVDVARQLLLIKGAVPGATNGLVIVRPAVKKRNAKTEAA